MPPPHDIDSSSTSAALALQTELDRARDQNRRLTLENDQLRKSAPGSDVRKSSNSQLYQVRNSSETSAELDENAECMENMYSEFEKMLWVLECNTSDTKQLREKLDHKSEFSI